MAGRAYPVSEPLECISGASILAPGYDPSDQYDVFLDDLGSIKDICHHSPSLLNKYAVAGNHDGGRKKYLDATNYLIAPSLCHAHVHLDKCFLLFDPKFEDLEILDGDFAEAMKLTSEAKTRFEADDLLRRGKWLVSESIAAGVTHMRAFVEVDHVVELRCLDAAREIKKSYASSCEIQICVFAQEPIFSGEHGDRNKNLIYAALEHHDVEAIGSTPYVESNQQNQHANVEWVVQEALKRGLHMDFHLDYHLDYKQIPLTPYVIDLINEHLKDHQKAEVYRGKVALGHCTRLTQYSSKEWKDLGRKVDSGPFHFVGLPTSDSFIQGKPSSDGGGGERPRGTLQIPQMIRKYGLQGAISINNVGNAFTPYGNCDPLSIASMGVGLYHAGTKDDTQILYQCISSRAKKAIGISSISFTFGQPADFVLFNMAESQDSLLSRQRGRRNLHEVVYDPPKYRKTIFRGRLITA